MARRRYISGAGRRPRRWLVVEQVDAWKPVRKNVVRRGYDYRTVSRHFTYGGASRALKKFNRARTT